MILDGREANPEKRSAMSHQEIPEVLNARRYLAEQAKEARARKILLLTGIIFALIFVGVLVIPFYHH